MNTPRHSAADEQASLWAARLEGSALSAADRAALDAWLAADPLHRTLLSQYCQFAADLELTLPALVEAGLVAMPEVAGASNGIDRMSSSSRARRGRWKLPVFAGTTLAAAAAVALTLWIARPRTQFEDLATAVAQHQSFTLADGSQVELNAHTRLRVAFTRGERHVQLSDGEAFFSVTKDKSRPFIVDTPSGSVRVTGTQFDVRSDGAPHFEVTVAEGSVQVRPGGSAGGNASPVLLGAGEKLSAVDGTVKVSPLAAVALNDALAWRQGQVVFDRVPLRDALARFARYHGREILASDSAAGLTIGGRFSLDDLEGFFSALEEIHPVKVARRSSGAIQVNLRDLK